MHVIHKCMHTSMRARTYPAYSLRTSPIESLVSMCFFLVGSARWHARTRSNCKPLLLYDSNCNICEARWFEKQVLQNLGASRLLGALMARRSVLHHGVSGLVGGCHARVCSPGLVVVLAGLVRSAVVLGSAGSAVVLGVPPLLLGQHEGIHPVSASHRRSPLSPRMLHHVLVVSVPPHDAFGKALSNVLDIPPR